AVARLANSSKREGSSMWFRGSIIPERRRMPRTTKAMQPRVDRAAGGLGSKRLAGPRSPRGYPAAVGRAQSHPRLEIGSAGAAALPNGMERSSVRSMPELPEVETIRRMLESTVRGRTIRDVKLSGLALRRPVPASLARHVKGRTIEGVGRHGKYLLIELDGGWTLLSHLGMSGRWLFYPERPREDR